MAVVEEFREKTRRVVISASTPIDLTLKANCGCGDKFKDLDTALAHSRETNHVVHILGEIRPQNR